MHKDKKLLLLGMSHIAVYFLIAWIFLPRIADNVEQTVGIPVEFKSCSSRSCQYGIKINSDVFTCSPSATGGYFSCAKFYKSDSVAQTKYFSMPTIFSAIGLSKPSMVLIEMRQDGEIIYKKTLDELRDMYFFPPSFFGIFVFLLSFWVIEKHSFFSQSEFKRVKKAK